MLQTDETLALLTSAPALAEVPLDSRRRIVESGSTIEVSAGETLIAEGDQADAAYLVLAGLFEIVAQQSTTQLRLIGRGAFVGEIAVLTRRPRSASVVALRPSTVLRIPAASLEALIDGEPTIARRIIEMLADQLAQSRAVATVQPLPRERVALIDGTGEMGPLIAQLLAQLADLVPTQVVELTGPTAAHDVSRPDVRRVAYVVGGPEPDLARQAARLADRALVFVCGPGVGTPPGAATWAGHEAVAVGEVAPDDVRDAIAVHDLRSPDDAEGLARLARRLAGRSVGLALSAGGARAYAHVGVIHELERVGLVVDRVAATSVGALVGSLYAAGHSAAEMHAQLLDMDFLSVGIEHGAAAGAAAAAMVTASCAERHRDLSMTSVDLVSGELVVHSGRDLRSELTASLALPGVFQPAAIDDALHVDGALIDPLPTDVLFAESDGPIVAVDVNSRELRVGRWSSKVLHKGLDAAQPADVAMQAIDLASVDRVAYCRSLADVLIDPDVPFPTTAWDRVDEIVEAGRVAAEASLAALAPDTRAALGI